MVLDLKYTSESYGNIQVSRMVLSCGRQCGLHDEGFSVQSRKVSYVELSYGPRVCR